MLCMLDGVLTWTAHSEHQEVWAGPSWSSVALRYYVAFIWSIKPFISQLIATNNRPTVPNCNLSQLLCKVRQETVQLARPSMATLLPELFQAETGPNRAHLHVPTAAAATAHPARTVPTTTLLSQVCHKSQPGQKCRMHKTAHLYCPSCFVRYARKPCSWLNTSLGNWIRLFLVRVLGTSWNKGAWRVCWWRRCRRPPTIRFAWLLCIASQ
jgi:hypothetical protein